MAVRQERRRVRFGRPRDGVLLVGVLPPPPGGVETISKLIWESPLRDRYHMRFFSTAKSRGKEYSGRIDLRNTVDAGVQVVKCLWLLLAIRPRVFHCPLSGPWSGFLRDMALFWLAKIMGCTTIAHSHGAIGDQLYADAAPWQQWLIRRLLCSIDEFVVLSPYWERHFARLAPQTPITVVPNCVRPLFLGEDLRPPGDHPAPFTILFVGEIGRRKGVYDLVDALPIIRATTPRIALRLVGNAGEPDALAELGRRMEALGMREAVTFVGPRYDEALLAEYLQADVYVLPTYAEGQPVALIEAMATGACVVSSAIEAVVSVVTDGEDGLLVPAGDVAALAASLVRALGDARLRATLGSNARRTVLQRFTPAQFLQNVEDVYKHVLDDDGGGGACH
jgi:glycosyltransferase involved in cell wall biosynthesis